MKKFSRLLVMLVAVGLLCSCFAFSGCSKSQEGEYHFKSFTAYEDGVLIELEEGESYMGMVLTKDFVKITLNADGTLTMIAGGEVIPSTWVKVNDEQIKVEDQICFCDGKTLKIEVDGFSFVLEK